MRRRASAQAQGGHHTNIGRQLVKDVKGHQCGQSGAQQSETHQRRVGLAPMADTNELADRSVLRPESHCRQQAQHQKRHMIPRECSQECRCHKAAMSSLGNAAVIVPLNILHPDLAKRPPAGPTIDTLVGRRLSEGGSK